MWRNVNTRRHHPARLIAAAVMVGLVVNSSDLVLAAGISFWTGVVETHRVRDIKDCYHIITALRDFLQHNKAEELTANVEEGFKAEKLEGNISKEDRKGEVHDPVKPVEINTDDSDLDDLFEVLDPSDPSEDKIEEERRKDSDGTEKSITERNPLQKGQENGEGFDVDNSSEENRSEENSRKVDDIKSSSQDTTSDVDVVSTLEKLTENKLDRTNSKTSDESTAMNVKKENIEDQECSSEEIVHEQEDKVHIEEEKVKTIHKSKKRSSKLSCDFCEEIFQLFFGLKKHVKAYHEELMGKFDEKYRTIRCKKCPASFYTSRGHRQHRQRFHPRNAQCSHCHRSFYSEEDLKKHEAMHENDRKVFTCDQCDKKIVGLYKFKKHLKNQFAHEAAVSCPHCPKLVKDLKTHLKVHDKPSYFVCDACGKTFNGNRSLTTHRKSCLSGLPLSVKENVKCRFCDSTFSTSMRKQTHEFKVHDINAQICSQCGHKSFGMSNFRRHMTKHSAKEIFCEQCGKTFKSKLNLNLHHQKMHRPDSEKPHKCSYSDCTRAFVTLESLESHTNSHLGIKPYQCDVCQTRFQNSSNKRAHMKKVHKFS